MNEPDPLWTAQRHGQNWRNEDILRAIAWLTSGVDSQSWSSRLDRVRQTFDSGKREWAAGNRTPLFDPEDAIAWYVFQAHAFAAQREDCYEPEAYRIVPIFRRLGQIVPQLRSVKGSADRVRTLMTKGRRQPDDGLFEFLVAGAYKCRSWTNVEFVPEQPGIKKTQDLLVSSSRRRWAVECKRVNRSGYEARERDLGDALAAPVHDLCRSQRRSIVLEVSFTVELTELSSNYLVERVETFLNNPRFNQWADAQGRGWVRDIDWHLADTVLKHDDIFFGSSRMVELLVGRYTPYVDHSVAADWIPAPQRPLFATAINQASVVSWMSTSFEAAKRKARHFRALVASADEQLAADLPGAIHVGYEARDGNSVDDLRHLLNRIEMGTFAPDKSRLRWVYGHYFTPEHTTARNESLAISETTATYKIGQHRTATPLLSNLLFSDEPGRPGDHWKK
jgi:hypothetical protein